ncbi:MAG TPA: DapH/DapD/GlmU-related protein [Phycisphaerae bacterium]|nr:DapH/DapD/GlmU-related protein [Phycisphaerae bacterium]
MSDISPTSSAPKENPTTKGRTLRQAARRAGCLTLVFVLLADPLALSAATLATLGIGHALWTPNLVLDALVLVLCYFTFPVGAVLALLVLRLLFARGRIQPGTYPLDSPAARLWLRKAALASLPRRSFFRNAVTGFSFLGPFFLRAMEAAVGKRISLGVDATIADPFMTTIGDDALIGDGAFLSAHLIERDAITIAPVTIGRRATIGAFAFVSPGTQVGDDAIVATGAVVAKNTRIHAGEIWGGIPARKIAEVKSRVPQGSDNAPASFRDA